MADPLSIAAAAAGFVSLSLQLLGGCIKGFIILSTARNFGKDAETIACMLDIQEIQLIEWAKRAGLLTNEGLLDRRLNAKAVEETLFQLQSLLLDTEKLKKKYGLDIKLILKDKLDQSTTSLAASVNTGLSNTVRNDILERSRVAENQSMLQRFWWAAVDKEKIEKLVADIHFFVRELWNLLDPWRQDDIILSTQKIAASMISLNQRFDQLVSLNEALVGFPSRIHSDDSMENVHHMAVSAKIKAYRIGLEQADESASMAQEPNLPPRRRLLAGLESLSASKLGEITTTNKSKTMGTATYDGNTVFIEEKLIPPSVEQKALMRAKNLAALLNISKARGFGSLQCRGIIEARGTVKFIFEHPYPDVADHQPRSLLELFHYRDGIKPPSLTDRIRLSLHIARLVQNFHRAGWLHKSLRSENILFFEKNRMSVPEFLTEPILAGFAFSRQDLPTEISEQPSADPKLDIYRHPAALGEPTASFTAEMDIYSLGTILLEIAEWRALRHLVESIVNVNDDNVPLNKIAAVRSFLTTGDGRGGKSRLQERMGNIYASACQICFSGRITDVEDEQSDVPSGRVGLLDAVIGRLEQCRV